MSRVENAICITILLVCGTITIIIMATLYLHSIQVEEPGVCVSETGHKDVPCP